MDGRRLTEFYVDNTNTGYTKLVEYLTINPRGLERYEYLQGIYDYYRAPGATKSQFLQQLQLVVELRRDNLAAQAARGIRMTDIVPTPNYNLTQRQNDDRTRRALVRTDSKYQREQQQLLEQQSTELVVIDPIKVDSDISEAYMNMPFFDCLKELFKLIISF